jgi:hypothetical protein
MDLLRAVIREASYRRHRVAARPLPSGAAGGGNDGNCTAGEADVELYITQQPGNRCCAVKVRVALVQGGACCWGCRGQLAGLPLRVLAGNLGLAAGRSCLCSVTMVD